MKKCLLNDIQVEVDLGYVKVTFDLINSNSSWENSERVNFEFAIVGGQE
jgi:hypothetical protein